MIKHLNVKIHGQVQGVFFRYSAKDKADGLGVVGFARNESDGTVYVEAEGEEERLNQFLEWCYQGPEMAMPTGRQVKIEKVDVEFSQELKNFNDFSIE